MRPQNSIALFEPRSQESKNKVYNYSVGQSYHEAEVRPLIKDKYFQMPNDVRSQNNIGLYTNPMLMSLPCRSVGEANGHVNLGNLDFFNVSNVNVKPVSWADKLGFVQERRGLTHDFKQRPLVINTYRR